MIWLISVLALMAGVVAGAGGVELVKRVRQPPLEIVPPAPDLARLGAEMTRTLQAALAVLAPPAPAAPERPSFTCPQCFEVTTFAADVQQGYCPHCHEWTGAPTLTPRPYVVDPGRHVRPQPDVPLDEYLPAGGGI